MVELAHAATIYVAQNLALKVLGPTADYIGAELRLFAEKTQVNIQTILSKAEKYLSKENCGSVPPKVIKDLLLEGGFCDDELSQEYFAGVLASSKSEEDRGDRGAFYTNIITSSSNYVIRAHYVLYMVAKALFEEKKLIFNIMENSMATEHTIYIKYNDIVRLMGITTRELEKWDSIFSSILCGAEQFLVFHRWGGSDHLKDRFSALESTEPGLVFSINTFGTQLFLWSQGLGDKPVNYFFDAKFQPKNLLNEDFNCGILVN